MYERRDKRGRRIGANWWREYNVGLVHDHNDNIERLAGENHQMEPAEFRETHPLLTLKHCLVSNKGMAQEPEHPNETEVNLT